MLWISGLEGGKLKGTLDMGLEGRPGSVGRGRKSIGTWVEVWRHALDQYAVGGGGNFIGIMNANLLGCSGSMGGGRNLWESWIRSSGCSGSIGWREIYGKHGYASGRVLWISRLDKGKSIRIMDTRLGECSRSISWRGSGRVLWISKLERGLLWI